MGAAQDIIARLKSIIRGGSEVCYGEHGNEASLQSNCRGDLLVAQGLPERTELARLGASWNAILITAVAPVGAPPTTTSMVSIYNADPLKSYVIDSVYSVVTVSAGAALSMAMFVMNEQNPQSAPATVLVDGPFSTSGRKYPGKAVLGNNVTVTNNGWVPAGPSVATPNTANAGLAIVAPVYGLYIVPPGGRFSVAVVANVTATITQRPGLCWHEVRLPVPN